MHPVGSMAAKVRAIDRRYIRLSEPLQAHVEHLARLAGVTSSDVVTFVLTEAFEENRALERSPETPPTPPPAPRPQRRPADVIPLRRPPVEKSAPGLTRALFYLDPWYLRRQAAEVRGVARAVRARAAMVCNAAGSARAKATNAIELARASL